MKTEFTSIDELPTQPQLLDSQSQALLNDFGSEDDASIFDIQIEDAREAFNPLFEESAAPVPEIGHALKRRIGMGRESVDIVELTPLGGPPTNGWSVLVFIHGGGWILGDYTGYEWLAKSLCAHCVMKVVFVDYQLSPEAKYPKALNQCLYAIDYIRANASAFDINPHKIGVVGDSAGGNLAASLSIRLRDDNALSPVQLQCLIYPFMDLRQNASYRSRATFGNGDYFLTTEHIAWSRKHYLEREEKAHSAMISPMVIDDFQQLPTTIMVTAGYDPLQDEAHAFHTGLLRAGVDSTLLHFPTTIHAFLSFSKQLDIARSGIVSIAHKIKQKLA